jgi:hypothetical protein
VPPTQLFFLISTVVILPIAWLKGGHPERMGVVVLLINYVSGIFLQPARVGEFMFGLAAADLVLLGVLGWLTLKYDRWWLIGATAAQGLVVLAYLAVLTRPEITARENIVAQWVFGLITLYALLGGVFERWLAGERSAAPPLSARPVSRLPVRARP